MNTFVTVMCFALVAMAAAKPAYNYQQPQQPFPHPSPQNFVPGPLPGPVVTSGPQLGPQVFDSAAPPASYAQQFATPTQLFSSGGQQFVGSSSQFGGSSSQFGGSSAQFGGSSAQFGGSSAQFGGSSSQFGGPSAQFVGSGSQYAGSSSQFVGPAPQFVAPVQQSVISSSQYQNQQYHQPQQQIIVSKDIFIHSAPEETEEIGGDQGPDQLAPIRKNYRIVFIKAPSQNLKLNLNALKQAQAANEEKTVIYVLSKKPDLANLQNQLTAVQGEQKTHKPEVYFIKYKTQEEANRAQQEIQAQYDALGGSTHVSDEGFAPVTSVIGGKNVNVGSVLASGSSSAPVFSSGSVSGPSFSSGSSSGSSFSSSGSNFVQSSSSNHQSFVQQGFQGSQGSASTVSFGAQAPSNKYLPAAKKK